MRLRYTIPAVRQLEAVLGFIAEQNPQGARHVQARIQVIINLLLDHPFAGQETSRPGIRRIVASPYPYVVCYRIGDGEIVVHDVRHAARRPIL